MIKITTSIKIDKRVLDHTKTNLFIENFSKWVEKTYIDEFMNEEYLKEKIDFHTKALEHLKQTLENSNKEEKKILNQYEEAWIKLEAPRRIAKATEEGVYKYFINKYNRKDITRRQFRLLVEKLTKND